MRGEGSHAPPEGPGRAASNNGERVADVSVETLLGRPLVDIPLDELGDYARDATVLVTGAGGSIGNELCRRLTRLGVRKLVLIDQAEAPLLELATALSDDEGFTDAVAVLADIRNDARVAEVLEEHTPSVVFHAAAYKHVPLLEAHPVEGVATNVLGTRSVVDAARKVGVERFVLFSTDKAVHPSSVLGRTKAVAEWVVAAGGHDAGRERYASIRLGNVIDSAGSILPLFRRQIARGGPITVTHPQMTRYLMTAGEAAALAIAAGALAEANEVFSLDVGPPVRVLPLAECLARAASVDVDVVGIRAGERLHEQFFANGDHGLETRCRHVFGSAARRVESRWLYGWLDVLARHVARASADGVRAALVAMHAEVAGELLVPGAVMAR
jgi:FlaA1/EpsC-like NDP-sugar epimerase